MPSSGSAVQWAMRCLSPPLSPATLRHMRHMSAPGSSTDLVTRPGKCSGKLGLESCDLWMFPRNGVKWGVELTQHGAGAEQRKAPGWIWRELVPSSLPFSSPIPSRWLSLPPLPSVSMGGGKYAVPPPTSVSGTHTALHGLQPWSALLHMIRICLWESVSALW